MQFKQVVSLLMIVTIVFTQLPMDSSAATSTASGDEYTKAYTNPDLSRSMELYPFSVFTQNPNTLSWNKKQEIDMQGGTISYTSKAEPESNFSSVNEVKVGRDETHQFDTFIKFGNSLPSLNGGLFLGAKLHLKEQGTNMDCYYCQYTINDLYAIYKILEPWNAQALTWSNQPTVSDQPVTKNTLSMPVGGSYYSWDVSTLVLDWYETPAKDFGLALKTNSSSTNTITTFTKLNQELNQLPMLEINYSSKPKAPIGISSGAGVNSGKGNVNLQWSSVTGATGYRVYLYNGKDYELVHEGAGTSWSSTGKNLWPTNEQLELGERYLRKDGSGTDLSENPGLLYQQFEKNEQLQGDTYYFRISAYNQYGETEQSDITAVKMPDITAPTVPEDMKASSELVSDFLLVWEPSTDRSPVEYLVKLTDSSGNQVFLGTSQANHIVVPENYLIPRITYQASVKAIDKSSYQSNYSAFSTPVNVTARKKNDAQLMSISYPTTVSEAGSQPTIRIQLKNVGVESWTQSGGYLLKADGTSFTSTLGEKEIIRTGDTKTFEYTLPSDMKLGTSSFLWRMFNVNSGTFGDGGTTKVTFEDRMKPQISLTSPMADKTVKGKVSLEGSISDYQLSKYQISYGYGENPDEWVQIHAGSETFGALGEWETTALKNGTYTLRIEAEDALGMSSTLEQIVYVKNPVPAPTIQQVTDQSTSVSGTAKAGTTIKVFANSVQIGNGYTTDEGTYTLSVPAQKPGTELKVVSLDGIDESEMVITKVKDITPPKQPVVNPVNNKTTAISGNAEPLSTISAKILDKVYTGKADATGKFTISIPGQNYGTLVVLTVIDSAGFKSIEKKMTVTRVAPNLPIVNTATNTAPFVSGKTERYATVIVNIGSRSYTAKADATGSYKVTIPVQNSGTAVKVSVKDSAGAYSLPRTVTVARVAPNSPIVNPVSNNAGYVTGKTEKYALVTASIGSKSYSSKADAYGNYKMAIPVQNSGAKISIKSKDTAGRISANTSVTVNRAAPNLPVANPVRYYSTSVTGKTEAHISVSVKIGTRTYSAKSNSYGNYKITIPKQKKGTKLMLTAKDVKGKISAPRTLTVY
ncbi:Ig-like domain-containing protein [Lysinibacillus sp. SGAir0095]|uniref:Ig-like domain-containing protein n=1 Tax=Lysinibacillus sp. SGAir0095 TaxID=2070463 RepID=UPI00143DA342|nr:Ig-like domain-containing protein [Lysinibacillus sp. SGAir0095]